MPLVMQAKLLRVLEERQMERVGGDRPFRSMCAWWWPRIATWTNWSAGEIPRGPLPPRLRLSAAAAAAARPAGRHSRAGRSFRATSGRDRTAGSPNRFAPEAIDELKRYPWPGNVRELRNVVERLLLLATGDSVDVATVHAALPPQTAATQMGGLGRSRVRSPSASNAFERQTFVAELRRHQNHITQTARALGLERSHLYKKCQQLGIDLRAMRKE